MVNVDKGKKEGECRGMTFVDMQSRAEQILKHFGSQPLRVGQKIRLNTCIYYTLKSIPSVTSDIPNGLIEALFYKPAERVFVYRRGQ
jgi:hypothetical protein